MFAITSSTGGTNHSFPAKLADSNGDERENVKHNSTRQKIQDSAGTLFTQHGFENTTMQMIADQVGIRAPSLYYHFPSKEHLLCEYLNNAFSELLSRTRQLVSRAGDDPIERLTAFVRGFALMQISVAQDAPFLDSYMFGSKKSTSPLPLEKRDELTKKQRQFIDLLRGILTDGKQQGLFQYINLKVTAFAIVGLIDHVSYWFKEGGERSESEVASEFCSLVLRSLSVPQND